MRDNSYRGWGFVVGGGHDGRIVISLVRSIRFYRRQWVRHEKTEYRVRSTAAGVGTGRHPRVRQENRHNMEVFGVHPLGEGGTGLGAGASWEQSPPEQSFYHFCRTCVD